VVRWVAWVLPFSLGHCWMSRSQIRGKIGEWPISRGSFDQHPVYFFKGSIFTSYRTRSRVYDLIFPKTNEFGRGKTRISSPNTLV